MFSKILVANRGEIAVRIIRACKEMGISTVAVYSEADSEALHVALADQAVCIGKASAEESYLNKNNIISAALVTDAQAIHPGYGFLAENADFANLCKKHRLIFIGPEANTISKLGDKEAARRLMRENGVPIIPGTDLLHSIEEALTAAEIIGYPVIIKARAGGGGKGIRIVEDSAKMHQAFQTAMMEAKNAFGDGGLYMEKYLSPAKHIEVQLLADEKGNVVCLGDRECSIQKNNQKLLEEAPSPSVTEKTRAAMYLAATRVAKAAKYANAGTVEFLLDKQNRFYFMEMNTRLQVEHPVTEQVTGIDIVKWQIRIAAGVALDFYQGDVHIQGASIECRINAGSAGKVKFLHIPSGPGIRFDTFLFQDCRIPPYYDSLLGKLIVFAPTREEAIRKMQSALCELVIDGIPNNIEGQLDILEDKYFRKGEYYADFMRKRGE